MAERQGDMRASSTVAVYDRIARYYDMMNAPMELLGGGKRRVRLLRRARGRTLEVGIGTGRNIDIYDSGVELTGVDLSPEMLRRAGERARTLGRAPTLELGDVRRLPFPSDTFDTVTATCVFCSADDPIVGLREVRRVVRPEGRVLLLEHVRPRGPVLGWIFDRLSPLARRLMGPEVNRRTEENVLEAGLVVDEIRREGIWREIVARKGTSAGADGPR